LDLRSTTKAVTRLPFDGDELPDTLRALEPTAANNPIHEEHASFWLVVAHQFAKMGIVFELVLRKALRAIAN
jgi:hypothetical protein